MTRDLTRRWVLAGMASTAGGAAIARAPLVSERPVPRGAPAIVLPPAPTNLVSQSEMLVRNAKLGGQVGFAVADATTGEMLEARLGETPLPPASTMKAVTAIYALDKLGPAHRFRTEVLALGPVRGGKLDGDLALIGGGDPTLDTDRLADLARLLREAGVTEVTGRFLVWGGRLPQGKRIDTAQPDHVSYNPSFGGLNLNFNRVHFQWERVNNQNYEITMHARAVRFSPATTAAHMAIVDRKSPVFDYRDSGLRDYWSVSRKALGKNGARWLPVRHPERYAGDVFKTLARSNGIVLRPPEIVTERPEGDILAGVVSEPLVPILQDMLKYSTNLTAEVTGMSASLTALPPATSLTASALRMAIWATRFKATGMRFLDHSGLGYGSGIAPEAMVRILSSNARIAPLMKDVNLSLDKKRPGPEGVRVRAKTGTLNFVSTLAGYVTTTSGRTLSFAIFTADTARRDAIPPKERERPQGAKGWSRRSRQLQKELIRGWAERFV